MWECLHNCLKRLVGASGFVPPTSGPEAAFINNLRASFTETRDLHVFDLDPIWTLKAKLWQTGLRLDPAWTLISTLVNPLLSRARAVASASQNKICCLHRTSKLPYRSTIPKWLQADVEINYCE